jgi:predicted amino acid dehydrogenase
MKRDYISEIDRIGNQLADLRATLAGQAGNAANDVGTYLAPRVRQFTNQFGREGLRLGKAAGRNPSAATGAIVGAMVLGAALAWLLSSAGREKE